MIQTSRAWFVERARAYWSQPAMRWLTAILVLAFVLRVVWVVYAAREPQGVHDPIFYFGYADAFAEGRGYALPDVPLDGPVEVYAGETAYYPVGYAAALGGVFALVKHTPIPDDLTLAAGYFQVALGVAGVWLVFALGRRLFGDAVGLGAALAVALMPNLIFHIATYLTETLFIALVLGALLVLIDRDWDERRIEPWRIVTFGVLLGLSALVRPISLLFLPLLPIVWLLAALGWRRTLGYSAAALVVTAATIAPWTLRNAVQMDAFVIISTNVGDNLCMGHHEGATGQFNLSPACGLQETPDEYIGLTREEFEIERNSDNTRTALEFAREHPVGELKLLSRKAYHTWRHDHDGLQAVESYGDDRFLPGALRTALERIADGYFFVAISLGGLGLAGLVAPRPDARRVLFLLALLALAGVPLVFFGDARFHVPVMPLLAVPAAWAVVAAVGYAPRLVAPRSGAVEVAEAERPVPEQDALEDS